MAEQYYQFVNGERVELSGDELIAKQAEWAQVETDRPATDLIMLRSQRNSKLAETDWWANSDVTMTQAQTDYRQALRDITNIYTSLADVVWPTKP